MAFQNSTIKVLSDLKQKDYLEIQQEICNVRKDSFNLYDTQFGDFIVTFDKRVDEYSYSADFIVFVDIRSKLEHGKFSAVARLESRAGVYYEDSKSSVSESCCIKIPVENSWNGPALITVKISKIGESSSSKKVYARQKKLTHDLYKSRESTGDVTIVTTSGAEHKAHKMILMTQSPFFKAVFEVNLKERQESKVKIVKFEENLVADIIEFMYVGWTDSIGKNPEALLEIAHMYQVKDLVEACWDSLMKTLNVQNAVKIFRLSGKFDDDGSYKKRIGRLLLKNFEAVRKTAEFAAMVKEDSDLFAEICGSDI